MGCCRSKDSDSEDGLASVRVETPPSWGNDASRRSGSASRNSSASRQPKPTPRQFYVGPSRLNVPPSRVNVGPSRLNVPPSRVNVGPSRVNVPPSQVNVLSSWNVVPNAPSPSRANGGPRYQPAAVNTFSDTSCIWDQLPPAQTYYPQPPADRSDVESIGHSSQHNAERHFFQHFFAVLDQVPGHKGIFKRWKREAQRAEIANENENMGKVWNEPGGYVKTLQRVKMLVYNKGFRESDRVKLADWAAKVVKRRTAQFNKAKAKGKDDSNHLKVLEEWRGVNSTIQNLL
ncbi:uncharacterized protein LOC116969303 [Amblyraja radiata]|uniref:uncharacterized protein LOC116969303 n=1 Tax=Amblyraja radiata TaxID=386614 RepID=UPI00140277E5|nr:uncharacterized protein LOC116969303 [Amblyraja radiata]